MDNAMKKENASVAFLQTLRDEISKISTQHGRRIESVSTGLLRAPKGDFIELLYILTRFYSNLGISPKKLASDYMNMISDMRIEAVMFYKTGEYSCKNQAEANERVYSNPEVMSYYLNALAVSYLFWEHHFNMLMFYKKMLRSLDFTGQVNVLDVGAGHGLFSYYASNVIGEDATIDVVDISEKSLELSRAMLGGKANYFNCDIADFDSGVKYNLIILGELLEHLDNPVEILGLVSDKLTFGGHIWLTVPTNAPAIDHIYLFKIELEVFDMVSKAGLWIENAVSYQAEGEETKLVGILCFKR